MSRRIRKLESSWGSDMNCDHYMVEAAIALFAIAAGLGVGFGAAWGFFTCRSDKPATK